MAEAVHWQPDGTPRNPRFDDIYRTASGGLEQARHVFLRGCDLPGAWSGQRQWRVLETGFGLGLNFLATWHAWRADPQRPHLLHFVSVEAWPVAADDIVRSCEPYADLQALAQELASRWKGLTGGAHRLSFDDGRVLLTLHVGDAVDVLRREPFTCDSVFLDGFDPHRNPRMWDEPLLKAVARHCRRGARLATWTVAGEVRRGLAQCGFEVRKADGLPPKRECLQAVYEPHWEPKGRAAPRDTKIADAVVIGAGVAGSATAASLARRGWDVLVIDAATQPASGASGLPTGLLAPHQSPDDNLLSRLSREGVRMTWQEAQRLLRSGEDWSPCGVLEHLVDGRRKTAPADEAFAPWTREADPALRRCAGLDDAPAHWHELAAWLKPPALVNAWLSQPGVRFAGGCRAGALVRQAEQWSVRGKDGAEIARASLVVIAAALGSRELLPGEITLNPVRGQVSWNVERDGFAAPPFPVNGHGHFIAHVPTPEGLAWFCGATFGRGDSAIDVRPQDHQANLDRIRELLPAVGDGLEDEFARGEVRPWTGARCTSRDRRPLVGEIEDGLWVCAALGSRGLTFCTMSAELLAARLHDEPLPIDARLADALDVRRMLAPR